MINEQQIEQFFIDQVTAIPGIGMDGLVESMRVHSVRFADYSINVPVLMDHLVRRHRVMIRYPVPGKDDDTSMQFYPTGSAVSIRT